MAACSRKGVHFMRICIKTYVTPLGMTKLWCFCFERQEIATPVCALVRNDMAMGQSGARIQICFKLQFIVAAVKIPCFPVLRVL